MTPILHRLLCRIGWHYWQEWRDVAIGRSRWLRWRRCYYCRAKERVVTTRARSTDDGA